MVQASSLVVALIDLISYRELDLNDWNFLELPFVVLGRLRNTVGKMMLKMNLKTMKMKSSYELINRMF